MINYDEVLCHCEDDDTGHPLGRFCAGITGITIRPGRHLRPEIPQVGVYEGIVFSRVDARGTCPVCSKNVKVQRLMIRANYQRGQRLEPEVNPGRHHGSVLEIRPGMAPHRVRGAECAGTGQVPTETRYTPGRELGYYEKLRAEESA